MKYIWEDNSSFSCYFDTDHKVLQEFNALITREEFQLVAKITHIESGEVAKKVFKVTELLEAKSWVEHELPFCIEEEEKALFEKAEAFRKKYKGFLRDCWGPGGVYCSYTESEE